MIRRLVIAGVLFRVPDEWRRWRSAAADFQQRPDGSIWMRDRSSKAPWACVSPATLPAERPYSRYRRSPLARRWFSEWDLLRPTAEPLEATR
jgi:hypothetical protein